MARQFTLENGMTPEGITKSLQRSYAVAVIDGCTTEILDDLDINDGWIAVTEHILAVYGASNEADQSFTPDEFGLQLYKAFGRGMETELEQKPFEQLPIREQLAWEVVARHSAFVTQGDEEDIDRLTDVELSWADRLPEYARQRGATFEHGINPQAAETAALG